MSSYVPREGLTRVLENGQTTILMLESLPRFTFSVLNAINHYEQITSGTIQITGTSVYDADRNAVSNGVISIDGDAVFFALPEFELETLIPEYNGAKVLRNALPGVLRLPDYVAHSYISDEPLIVRYELGLNESNHSTLYVVPTAWQNENIQHYLETVAGTGPDQGETWRNGRHYFAIGLWEPDIDVVPWDGPNPENYSYPNADHIQSTFYAMNRTRDLLAQFTYLNPTITLREIGMPGIADIGVLQNPNTSSSGTHVCRSGFIHRLGH